MLGAGVQAESGHGIRRNKVGYHSQKPIVGFPGGQESSQPWSLVFPSMISPEMLPLRKDIHIGCKADQGRVLTTYKGVDDKEM